MSECEYDYDSDSCARFWDPFPPFGLVSLFIFSTMVFALSYYILFCHIWLLFLRILFFSNVRQKGGGYGREGRWRGARWSRWRGGDIIY